jgi:hypothetical protein
MEWRCAECGCTYDEAPEVCACGSANLEPVELDADPARVSGAALRERALSPNDADRSLVREEPYVSVAFRLVLAAGALGALFLAVRLFV